MHIKYLVVGLFLLLAGCIFPSVQRVCADGSLIQADATCPPLDVTSISVYPDQSGIVPLQQDSRVYVRSQGLISVEYIVEEGQSTDIFLFDLGSPGYSDYETAHSVFYRVPQHEDSGLELGTSSTGSPIAIFLAPRIPGNYSVATHLDDGQRLQRKNDLYYLTVVDEVSDEQMALAIADRHMDQSVPDDPGFDLTGVYRTKKDWTIVSKSATLTEDGWLVEMEASYDLCGIDWDYRNCIRDNRVKGTFLIDRMSGQIIG